MPHRILSAALLCALATVPVRAHAETLRFRAALSPATEVPSLISKGAGTADASLDTATGVLTYNVAFGGFDSPITAAHFHGPAAVGVNAGVVVPLGTNPASPIHGSVTLSPDQQKQLEAGLWYANLHTSVHPKGAARGQMLKAK